MSTLKQRKLREFPGLGKLRPYEYGQGWYVIPARGGLSRAQHHRKGFARNLRQGQTYLDELAALQDNFTTSNPAPPTIRRTTPANGPWVQFLCPYCGWVDDTVHAPDHHQHGSHGPHDERTAEHWRSSSDGGKKWTEHDEEPIS